MIGKRGEDGRVIAGFRQADLAMMRPADQVAVRTCGHGSRPTAWPAEVTVLNLGPGLLPALPISVTGTGCFGRAWIRPAMPA